MITNLHKRSGKRNSYHSRKHQDKPKKHIFHRRQHQICDKNLQQKLSTRPRLNNYRTHRA